MTILVENLEHRLTLDDRQFQLSLVHAGQTLRRFERELKDTDRALRRTEAHSRGLAGGFRGLVITAGALRFALMDIHEVFLGLPIAIVQTAAQIERTTFLLRGLSNEVTEAGKAAEAAKGIDFLFRSARNAPFDLKALTDMFVKLKVVGIDPMNGSMQTLLDTGAKFGRTSEEMHRVSVAIQQMAGKGVISMEELRQQLGEAFPDALRRMAEGMGITVQKLVDMVSKGTVASIPAIEKMFASMDLHHAGAAKEMMKTWNGLIAQMKTRWELFKNDVALTSGGFDAAKNEVRELLNLFDSPQAKRLMDDMGFMFANLVKVLGGGARMLVEYFEYVEKAILGLIALAGAKLIRPFDSSFDAIKQRLQRHVTEKQAALAQDLKNANKAHEDAVRRHQETIRNHDREVATAKSSFAKKKTIYEQEIAAHQTKAQQLRAQALAEAQEQARIDAELARARERQMRTGDPRLRNDRGQMLSAQRMTAQSRAHAEAAAAATRAAQAEEAAIVRKTNALSAHSTLEKQQINQTYQATQATLENTRKQMANTAEKARAAQVTYDYSVQVGRLANAKRVLASAAVLAGNAVKGFIFSIAKSLLFFGGMMLAIEIAIRAWKLLSNAIWGAANAQDSYNERLKRAQEGFITDEDRKKHQERIQELSNQIEKQKQLIAQAQSEIQRSQQLTRGVREEQFIEDRKRIVETAQDKLKKLQEDLQREREKIGAQIVKVDRRNEEARRTAELETLVNERYTEAMKVVDQATRTIQDAKAKAELGSDKALQERLAAELPKVVAAKIREQAGVVQQELDRLEALVGDDRTEDINVRIESLRKTRDKLLETAKTWTAQNQILQKEGKEGRSRNLIVPEDPLNRAIEQAKGNLEQAKLRLEAFRNDLRDFNQLQLEAAADIIADATSGKFDTKIKSEDGKKLIEKAFGDTEERKKWMEQFQAQLAMGERSIVKIVQGLTGMTDEQRAAILAYINLVAAAEQKKEALDAITFAYKQATEIAAAYLDVARGINSNELIDGGRLARELQGWELRRKNMKDTGDELKRFNQHMRDALSTQALMESTAFARDAYKTFQQGQIESIVPERMREQARFAYEMSELDRVEKATLEYYDRMKGHLEDYERTILNIQAGFDALREAKREEHQRKMKTGFERFMDSWTDTAKNIDDATTDLVGSLAEKWLGWLETGKMDFADWVKSLGRQLLNLQFREMFAPGFRALGEGIRGLFASTLQGQKEGDTAKGLGDGMGKLFTSFSAESMKAAVAAQQAAGGMNTVSAQSTQLAMQMIQVEFAARAATAALQSMAASGSANGLDSLITQLLAGAGGNGMYSSVMPTYDPATGATLFAKGGVMTEFGAVALKKYSKGGIARKPQLALYGEGTDPEAYVPLPDGRSIPVTMRGSPPPVTVNVVNQSGVPVQGQAHTRFDGKQMILDVVLTAATTPGPFRDGIRQATS